MSNGKYPSKQLLDYLLQEGVGVAEPEHRAELVGDDQEHNWPEGWWGVWDEDNGFIAYFQFEADAYAFRLFLITVRQQGKAIAGRYKK